MERNLVIDRCIKLCEQAAPFDGTLASLNNYKATQECIAALKRIKNMPKFPTDVVDPDCICHGNWRLIVKNNEHLIGQRYVDRDGDECVFYGIVHGGDDYYYGMHRIYDGRGSLLSCVGSIEGYGYELVDPAKPDRMSRLEAALNELHATVMGECPSLLKKDSGGNAKLSSEIEDLLR